MRTLLFITTLFTTFLIASCDNSETTGSEVVLTTPFESIEVPIGAPIYLFNDVIHGHLTGTVKEFSVKTTTPELVKITKRIDRFEIEGLKNGTPNLYLLVNGKQKFNLSATLKTLPIKLTKPILLQIDMQAETSITKASIKDYFENFQTIKSLIIENPPLIDSLTILSDFDNFKFVSTKKSPTKQSLNLIINDTLRVKANVESLFNLFPVKVGDVWEFDYFQHAEQSTFGTSDPPTGYRITSKSTWTCIEIDDSYFRFREVNIGERVDFSGRNYVPPPYNTYTEVRSPFVSKRDIGIRKVSPHFQGIFSGFNLLDISYKYHKAAIDTSKTQYLGFGSSALNQLKLDNINALMRIRIDHSTRYNSFEAGYTRILP